MSGIKNNLFRTDHVEEIAAERIEICRTNACGFYSADGEESACHISGECCKNCGCNLALKARSLSSDCALKEQGLQPLWEAVMKQEEEDFFREKSGIKNE